MRNPSFRLTVLGALLSAAVSIPIVRVIAEEKPTESIIVAPGPFDQVPKATLDAWKKKYAFESLRPRLKYETAVERGAPKVGDEAAKRLKEVDQLRSTFESSNRRALSLAMLHGENVDKFVKSPGFGFSRMPPPGPSYLHEEQAEESVPLASVAPLSEGDASFSVAAPLVADASAVGASANRFKMPAADEVAHYHQNMSQYFAWYDRNGFIKSVDQVAGFKPHAILWNQPAPVDIALVAGEDPKLVARVDASKRWKVARMELVSLLKHETPRVYLSDNLPRMDELSSLKTREPSAFEKSALEKLAAGEDLDTASTPNRIEMLGSLRASKQCMQCHQVSHGSLLGAFSYELRRDPPLRVEPAKLAPVQ